MRRARATARRGRRTASRRPPARAPGRPRSAARASRPAGSMPRSPLLPIFLIVAVDVLGLTIILPLLPFYAEHYGASPLVVGLLTASFAACQLVSGPLIGRISDRV